MAEVKVDQEHSVSPILSSVEDPEKRRVLNEIEALGLTEKLQRRPSKEEVEDKLSKFRRNYHLFVFPGIHSNVGGVVMLIKNS